MPLRKKRRDDSIDSLSVMNVFVYYLCRYLMCKYKWYIQHCNKQILMKKITLTDLETATTFGQELFFFFFIRFEKTSL